MADLMMSSDFNKGYYGNLEERLNMKDIVRVQAHINAFDEYLPVD